MGLDDVELVMSVEAAFEIELADHLAAKVVTMGDLLELVWSELHRQHGDLSDAGIAWDRSHVWQQIVGLAARQMGLDPATIAPESRLVEDLGLGV